MKTLIRRTTDKASIGLALLLLVIACGGKRTIASMPSVDPPVTTDEIRQPEPNLTLRGDAFDAPAALAVSEAKKASQVGGHEGMEMRGITPGQDRENPPTPAPAFRDGSQQAIIAAPSMDHTSHGQQAPPAARPQPKRRTRTAPAATIYTCPMHPEVTSTKPGTCPKCGMALVKRK